MGEAMEPSSCMGEAMELSSCRGEALRARIDNMSYNLDPKKMTEEDWLLTNCKERSLYIIQNYPKTEKKLREKLKQGKKYSDKIIDEAIKFLKKYNYINDEEFAKRYIELHAHKETFKVMRQKLYVKGVPKDLIEKVINDTESSYDEMTIAKNLLIKKYPNFEQEIATMDMKQKQKIYQYLLRKGVKYDIVLKLVKESDSNG